MSLQKQTLAFPVTDASKHELRYFLQLHKIIDRVFKEANNHDWTNNELAKRAELSPDLHP